VHLYVIIIRYWIGSEPQNCINWSVLDRTDLLISGLYEHYRQPYQVLIICQYRSIISIIPAAENPFFRHDRSSQTHSSLSTTHNILMTMTTTDNYTCPQMLHHFNAALIANL